jgi:hypothetical protein
MASRSKILIAFALVVTSGCSTAIALTDSGRLVHVATDADLPMGCNLIGDVPIGTQADAARAATEDDLVILMRNKAGDLGGNHVVVDSKEPRGETEEGRHWVGRGRAYNCPPTEAQPSAPPEEETSGGEVEDDGEGGESEGEGEAAGDDALNDEDLL